MDPHPDLANLVFLVGTWTGSGRGDYPTIDGFEYDEEVEFSPLPGKPIIRYSQLTRRSGTDQPLHSETGYLRAGASGRVELSLAQPTGLAEVHDGTIDGSTLRLRSVTVARTPTAVEVTEVERHIEVLGDTMRYRMSMAAVGQPLQLHLAGTLERRM